MYPTDGSYPEYDGPTKGELKREAEAMQAVGKRLVELSSVKIKDLPITETLKDAALEHKRITSHEARRRHLKRIGKLVREHDVEALSLAIDKASPDSSLSMKTTIVAQRWCERFAEDSSNETLTHFIDKHPTADVQKLRQLLSKAAKELASGKPGKARSDLLRYVRELVLKATK